MADSEFEEFRHVFERLPQHIKAPAQSYTLVHDVFLDEDSPTSPKSDPCDEDSLASLASLGSLGLNNNPCTPPPPLPPPPPPPPLASATSDSNANSSASTSTSANASLVSVGGAAGAALGLGRAARRRAPPAPTPPGDPQEQETGGDARAVAGRRAGRGPGALRLAAAARAVRHRRPDAAPARAQVPQLPARRRQLPGLGALPQHRRGLGQLHGALARRPQVLVAAAAAHRAVPVARVARIARVGGQQRRHALPAAGAAGGDAPRPAQVHPAPHRRDRGGDRRPHLRAEGGRRPLVRSEKALKALSLGLSRGRARACVCACEGVNLRSGLQGIFPSAYAVDVDYSDFDPSTPKVKRERYLLGYLGSVETRCHKGNSVLCQAVRKIAGAGGGTPALRPHACILEVSDQGLRMVDRRKPAPKDVPCHDYFYSLKNVSFCAFHPRDHRYMGFITKHPQLQRFACHVFVGQESTRPVAEAVGRAFQRFYTKFIETAYPIEDIYIE